ncbi:MAG: sulfite oxidase [Nitrospirales bacterium]
MDGHGSGEISRRWFLVRAASGAVIALTAADLWSFVCTATADDQTRDQPLITRVERPQDLETPVSAFMSWLTPNDRFFIRSHFGPPKAESLKDWHLHVQGNVIQRLTLSLADLKQFEEITLTAVIQCSGNGRAFFHPKVPGAQWERGAVGNATWTGVRLADVLNRAGLGTAAHHVHMLGADRPLLPTVPLFIRSIPVEKALHPATLLAYRMNGAPLSLLHGAPLRLIVPGWAGDACVKWLTHLNVQELEAEGYFMKNAYRMPRSPITPGTQLKPSETRPVEEMPVKSIIARPENGASVTGGEVLIQGIAWTGDGEMVRVDVSMDNGRTWREAELIGKPTPYAWRLWQYLRQGVQPGTQRVLSRATDSHGHVQPMTTPWNPGGFLWNGVDRIDVTVTAS